MQQKRAKEREKIPITKLTFLSIFCHQKYHPSTDLVHYLKPENEYASIHASNLITGTAIRQVLDMIVYIIINGMALLNNLLLSGDQCCIMNFKELGTFRHVENILLE